MSGMATAPCLVIFDCDGTLIDSQKIIVAAMEHAFNTHHLVPPTREDILSIVGLSLFEAVHRLLPDETSSVVREVSEGYKNAFGRLRAELEGNEPLY